jgi:hypothetical protein
LIEDFSSPITTRKSGRAIVYYADEREPAGQALQDDTQ